MSMLSVDAYEVMERRAKFPALVLENERAFMLYHEDGTYTAVERERRGHEYGKYPQYHRSTTGSFKKAQRAFEMYSGIVRPEAEAMTNGGKNSQTTVQK